MDTTIPYSIENLYSEYYSTYQNGADFMIGFYENNSVFFKNIKPLKDKEELKMYIELIGRYIDALYTKGHYTMAINTVDKYLPLINEEIERLNAKELKNIWYYQLDFVKGMASYNLNDYKTATRIFKRLVLIDNKNDKYKNWLNSSKYYLRNKFIHIFQIGCFIVILVDIFFSKNIPSNIGIPLDEIAMTAFLLTFLYDYYIRYNRRSKWKQ